MACEALKNLDDMKKLEELEEKAKKHAGKMEKKYGIMPDDDKGSASKEDKKAYWEAIEKEMEDCLDL